ncbi:MAG TPA: DUF438 domain-containing protein [Firmicutes bacterium]|jgi:DUF438 domain-containing protein|nr:DUF438 domain-containing protein [Bacillota bacterium]
MSELINNRQKRQEKLKDIIRDLHAGADVEELKQRFKELLGEVVSPTEISEMEQALINEGMPAEEIQALCDVHVAVFREALDRQLEAAVEQTQALPETKIHPVNVFKQENKAVNEVLAKVEQLLDQITDAAVGSDISSQMEQWDTYHQQLMELDKHYRRKENILFPYLEKNGITGPPSVMWGIHDEIRAQLKEIDKIITETNPIADKQLTRQIADIVNPCHNAIKEMIYKEENILFPMCLETLTAQEWQEISAQEQEIGYTIIKPEEIPMDLDPVDTEAPTQHDWEGNVPEGLLKFASGYLSLDEISRIFNTLPVDITFVDKDDRVRYFSQGRERIFDRTPAVIGRDVQNCHPPASVHIVNKIVDDFKTHKRSHADFWIQSRGMFIYIQYFAVYDDNNEYMGTLEVTQNIAPLRALEGEKRLDDSQMTK